MSEPVIEVIEETNVIEFIQDDEPIIEVFSEGLQGIQGEPGLPGSTTGSYLHLQSLPNEVWTVQHNLGFEPNFAVYNQDGQQLFGWTVTYTNLNVSVILFKTPVAGSCRAS